MPVDVVLDLNVELDEAVHGHSDGNGLEGHDPDMGESWVQRLETVPVDSLGYD